MVEDLLAKTVSVLEKTLAPRAAVQMAAEEYARRFVCTRICYSVAVVSKPSRGTQPKRCSHPLGKFVWRAGGAGARARIGDQNKPRVPLILEIVIEVRAPLKRRTCRM